MSKTFGFRTGSVLLMLVLFCTLFIAAGVSAASVDLQQAPLNPEFVKYTHARTAGEYKTVVTSDGYALGLVPSPIYRPQVTDMMLAPSATGVAVPLGSGRTAYPATYNLTALGKVSPVKDQSLWGTCWAHASIASAESSVMPASPAPDYSEKSLVNHANFGGWDVPDGGGNAAMAMATFARWNGPVTETADPYPINTWTNSPFAAPVKHVQNAWYIPPRTNRAVTTGIKAALTNYGAVYSSFYWNTSQFYKPTTRAYYQPPAAADASPGGGHAVTIVGWNDNYSKTNFKTTPAGNGAWLVKNSWGTAWGNGGYFWVSYYDKWFASAISNGNYRDTAVFRAEAPTNYNRIYSYDNLGEVSNYKMGSQNKSGSFANVFTTTSAGKLKAVGFYTTDVNVPVTVKIYKNPTTSGPETGTLATTYSTTRPNMGYNTIALPVANQVALAKGQKFSVVITVTNPTYNYYIPAEINSAGYAAGVISYPYQSYAKYGSTWYDWWDALPYDYSNICIKAYTT